MKRKNSGRKSKTPKKDFYRLSVIFKNGFEFDENLKEKGHFACYRYSENSSRKRLLKIAHEGIGRIFNSALIIPTGAALKDWEIVVTANHGEETKSEWLARKENEKLAKGGEKSLLKLSFYLKESDRLYAKAMKATGKPYITMNVSHIDLKTGEIGYHVALNNCRKIVESDYWKLQFAAAYVWHRKQNKKVFQYNWLGEPKFLCVDFQNIIKNLIYEPT